MLSEFHVIDISLQMPQILAANAPELTMDQNPNWQKAFRASVVNLIYTRLDLFGFVNY